MTHFAKRLITRETWKNSMTPSLQTSKESWEYPGVERVTFTEVCDGKMWKFMPQISPCVVVPVSIRLRVSIYGFNIQMKCFNNLNLDACIFGDSGESSVKLSAAGSRTRRWQGIDPQVLLLKPLESWAKVRPSISAAQMRRYTVPPSSFRLSVCRCLLPSTSSLPQQFAVMGKVFGSSEYVNYSYHTLKITDASRSAVFRKEHKQQGIRGEIKSCKASLIWPTSRLQEEVAVGLISCWIQPLMSCFCWLKDATVVKAAG